MVLNVWSRSSSFPILKTLAFFRPTNLASEPTILSKRLCCLPLLSNTDQDVLAPPFWRDRFGAGVLALAVLAHGRFGAGRFGANIYR